MPQPEGRRVILCLADDDAREFHQVKHMPSQYQSIMDESGYQSQDTDDSDSHSSSSAGYGSQSNAASHSGDGEFCVENTIDYELHSWDTYRSEFAHQTSHDEMDVDDDCSQNSSSHYEEEINVKYEEEEETGSVVEEVEDGHSEVEDGHSEVEDVTEEGSDKGDGERDGVEEARESDNDEDDEDGAESVKSSCDSLAMGDLFDGIGDLGSYYRTISLSPDPDEMLGAVGGCDLEDKYRRSYYYPQPRIISCSSNDTKSDLNYLSRFSSTETSNKRKESCLLQPFEDADEYFIQNIGFRKMTGRNYAFPKRVPITIAEVEAFWQTDFQVGDGIYPRISAWAESNKVPSKKEDLNKYNFYCNLHHKWVNCNRSVEIWYKKYAGYTLREIAFMSDSNSKRTSDRHTSWSHV